MDTTPVKNKEGDFNVIGILKIGWDRRKFILRIVLIFTALGLFVALLSPKAFTAKTTIMPQVERTSSSGQLGGLASLAGINIGNNAAPSEIPPTLYPKILESVNFKRELIKTPVTLGDGTKTTYQEYYEEYHNPGFLAGLKKYTFGLPGVIRGLFRKNIPSGGQENTQEDSVLFKLTSKEVGHFSRLKNQAQVEYSSKDKTVELSFEATEPLMAAEMAKASEELLQEYVIAFRIQNASEQLDFAQKQFDEKREEFLARQQELASFSDRNRNIASAVARNQLQRLEAEYNFAFNLYTEMAKQLEQARLQVSKDTPIFSVLNPVTIPHTKSAPNRLLIVIVFIALGVLLAVGILFIQYFLMDLKYEFALKELEKP